MTRFFIETKNLPAESGTELARVLRTKLEERMCTVANDPAAAELRLSFALDSTMKKDSFLIEETAPGAVLFRADALSNLFAAAGRFLTLGHFDCIGSFAPAALPIAHTMKKELRGMYLATHFYNFYHAAPIEEIYPIIADLALRGYNALCVLVASHHYTSFLHDPEAVKMINRTKKIFGYAALCGMAPALIVLSNTCFYNYPRRLAAQHHLDDSGRYKVPLTAVSTDDVCPSLPGGMEEIEREHRELYEAFRGFPIKYFILWEYDEGGCLCEKCYPWITNGFMRIVRRDVELIREYGFDAKICLSAWHFDLSMQGEWDNFYSHLAAGEYPFLSYVLTSFRTGLPPVVAKNGVPKGVKFIDFPEISMCGIKPWGAYGANPISMWLDNLEEMTGSIHDGGFPYSEGIFEDINKWICAGFYTGYYEHAADAVRDYIRFEFGLEDTGDLLRAVQLMEDSLPRSVDRHMGEDGTPGKEPYKFSIRWGRPTPEIYRIIMAADEKMPACLKNSWKWRVFVLRAVIDKELYPAARTLIDSPAAQAAFHELNTIFHTENALYEVSVPEGK